jgi:hypothetical protein
MCAHGFAHDHHESNEMRRRGRLVYTVTTFARVTEAQVIEDMRRLHLQIIQQWREGPV